MDKIDRNELFALLGRGGAALPRSELSDPDQPPEADWEDEITTAPSAHEIFQETSRPAAHSSSAPAQFSASAPVGYVAPVTSIKTIVKGPTTRSDQAKLQRLVEQSVPRLWKYAVEKSNSSDPGIQRQKLRELLVWLFEKEGYSVVSNAAAPYRWKNKEVKGRIDLVIHRREGPALLAVETDWTKEPASILKLSGISRQKTPVVWIVGASCDPSSLLSWRRFADEVSASRSSRWLPILHLTHGWIND